MAVLWIVLLVLPVAVSSALAQPESLDIIGGSQRNVDQWMFYTDSENALYHHLAAQAFELLEKRVGDVGLLTTADDWRARQVELRKTFMEIVGPFPKKTPLNPKVTGVLQKDGYRVEKVIFESMPNFHVTAALFVPDGLKGKAPGILFCLGHSAAAFRRPLYQDVILNLVKKGFVVLALDPIGQGERLQYFDPGPGESTVGSSTKEHSYAGAQCFISGSSIARYFIWDGIRAIDYLISREEVDGNRIGCHGLSGGGTQSSYLGAFDPRIKAVAPTGYITSLRRLIESIGPQDGEQNMYHDIFRGIDHADLLAVRAPKPALLVTTTRDFFSIQGSRETVVELKRTYRALGNEADIGIVEDDFGHGYTSKNRVAINAFFQKHLDLPGSDHDEEVEYLTPDELQITETGQISTALGSRTVFDINAEETEELVDDLKKSRRDLPDHMGKVIEAARRLSGYEEPGGGKTGEVFGGRYQRDGYVIEKYFVPGEGGGDYVIPFLLFIPEGVGKSPGVLYLHPSGKNVEAGIGGEIEYLVNKGKVVLAPDLIGIGEMGPGEYRGDAYDFKLGQVSYNLWFLSLRIGRSIVGVRAGDVLRLVNFLKERGEVSGGISALARGEMCPVLLHAAAFSDDIAGINLIEPPISYRAMVMNRFYRPSYIHGTVAGALTAYDLPDLAACIAPRKILMVNVADQNGYRAGSEVVEDEYRVARRAYSNAGAADKLTIKRWEPFQGRDELFGGWF
ncbi:alpha/beta hydrolase family protein [candidate division KSB1 bacterium]